jgi:uncharacterized protein
MAERFVYRFAWDPEKAAGNRRKHGVTFELAATAFRDPLALSRYDDEHSEAEERWLTLGLDENGALLVVSHVRGARRRRSSRARDLGPRSDRARARAVRERPGPLR